MTATKPARLTAARKPKKGDTIFIARIWDNGDSDHMVQHAFRPAVSIRELRVESWGKQQATFTDVHSGEFIRERGYTEGYAFSFTREGLADQIEALKDRIKAHLAGSIKNNAAWLDQYTTSRPDVIAKVRRDMASKEAALAGHVIVGDYHELVAEVREWCARRAAK